MEGDKIKTYEVVSWWECSQTLHVKATSKAEAEKIVKQGNLAANEIEWTDPGNFGSFLSIESTKLLKKVA